MASIAGEKMTDRQEIEMIRAALLRAPRDRDLNRRLHTLRRRLRLTPIYQKTLPTPKDQPKRKWWHDEWRRVRAAFNGKPDLSGYHRIVVLTDHDQDVVNCLRSRSYEFVPVSALSSDARTLRRSWLIRRGAARRPIHRFADSGGYLIPASARRFIEFVTPLPRSRNWIDPEPVDPDDILDSLRYYIEGDVWTRRGRE